MGAEVARVRQAGGTIVNDHIEGDSGDVPMTRGFGNFDIPGFTEIPEVQSVAQDEVAFLVVASDGVWDNMTAEECADHIRQWCDDGCTVDQLSRKLVQEARCLQRKRRSDDIAVIVALLPPPLRQPSVGAAAVAGAS